MKSYLKFYIFPVTLFLSGCGKEVSTSPQPAATSCSTSWADEDVSETEVFQRMNTDTRLLVKLSGNKINFVKNVLVDAHRPSVHRLGKMQIHQIRTDLLSIQIPLGSPARHALQSLLQSHDIEFIEPDFVHSLTEYETPLPASEASVLPLSLDHEATKEIIVAVIDTGVDYNHKDLKNLMWTNSEEIPNNNKDDDKNGYVDDIHGWDFANNDQDPMADDTRSYHGTHVAGIVQQASQLQKVGIRIKIMALKYLDKTGSGRTSQAVGAVDYAVKNGALILNNSWGSMNYSQSLWEAIERARKEKRLFIAASGNGDSKGRGINIDKRPFYPAAYKHSNIISVAAANGHSQLTPWSNFGKSEVDIAAPGLNIRSARNGNAYATLSGTSMAAPFVAGVAALAWSRHPKLDYLDVRALLLQSADRGSAFFGKVVTGGEINPKKTLEQASRYRRDPALIEPDTTIPEECPLSAELHGPQRESLVRATSE